MSNEITQLISENILRDADSFKHLIYRFKFIHNTLKKNLFKPIMKWFAKKFGKYLIQGIDDFKPTWYNNQQRIFYHTFMKSMNEAFDKIDYPLRFKDRMTLEEHREIRKTLSGYVSRELFLKMAMTEAAEDTFDRDLINILCFNIAREMIRTYGVDFILEEKQFPLFVSLSTNNPQFFINNKDRFEVWRPQDESTF
jgi:hypothetical protein